MHTNTCARVKFIATLSLFPHHQLAVCKRSNHKNKQSHNSQTKQRPQISTWASTTTFDCDKSDRKQRIIRSSSVVVSNLLQMPHGHSPLSGMCVVRISDVSVHQPTQIFSFFFPRSNVISYRITELVESRSCRFEQPIALYHV